MSDYHLKLSPEELIQMIKQHLIGPSKDLLSEAIISVVKHQSWQLDLIVKASLGIRQEAKHNLYDTYLCRLGAVSTYQIDEAASKAAGLVINDKITVTIKNYDPWVQYPYRIEYTLIDTKGIKQAFTDTVTEDKLTVAEEFPEDF